MRRIRRPWTWLAVAGALGFLGLRFLWTGWSTASPSCVIRRFTGLQCPGCGGTRCAVRLLDGDIAGAIAMNPLVVLLAALGTIWIGYGVFREWKGEPRPLPLLPSWVAWSLAIVVIGFGVVRNLPWWPFTLLVPH
ncbi:DUF2752 domain-containing protein [Luteolibacter luteus]|uniref:DUF2752 domain-containing protein n=1 Tax=Luteolibacter luteus TaxID=2728835 RepID=A0A858RPK2_9BACT|nr:DUF2752 domain-containing protein [Luteolibacter luteus]QJE98444.1 DUF2752 domain-containing protein [Luteolibacter luteus]